MWGGIAGFTACLVKPGFVSITPDYGYVDGCADVTLQGHHLGDKATAKIGDAEFPVTAATDVEGTPEWATDVGFKFSGVTPPSPTGESGWFDVSLTIEGESEPLIIPQGWYYRACPASFRVDSLSLPADGSTGNTTTPGLPTVTPGTPIAMTGCGLDGDVTVRFMQVGSSARVPAPTGTTGETGDTGTGPIGTGTTATPCGELVTEVATAPLVSDCSSAIVHADVPTLPPGTYDVWVTHTDGTVYFGDVYQESGDTGLTCGAIRFVVGGAK